MATHKYWSTQYPGVRYREHPTRKHNGKPDRYYTIRYKNEGKDVEEALGWASCGMNAQKAQIIRSEIVEHIRLGEGFQSLREKRKLKLLEIEKKKADEEKASLDNLTIAAIAARFLEWSKYNRSSYPQDESRWRLHLQPEFGSLRVRDLTALHVENFRINLIKKELSHQSVHHCLALLRAMINKSHEWGVVAVPLKVKTKKPNNERTRYLNQDEAHRLLDALASRSQQWHDIAMIGLHCGLRAAEIFRLKWMDIDFLSKTFVVRETKNSKARHAYFTPEVESIFRSRYDETISEMGGYVFLSKKKTLIGEVSQTFARVVDDLGFNKGVTNPLHLVVFHTLRHTFCSWLAIQGTPLVEIKELAGHSSIQMVERYAHLCQDQKRKSIERLVKNFSYGVRIEQKKI